MPGKVTEWQDIPPELVANIVACVHVADLPAVRLVNRQLRCEADVFIFQQKAVELTTKSLTRLLHISNHPQYQHSIHTLSILPSFLEPQPFEDPVTGEWQGPQPHHQNGYEDFFVNGSASRAGMEYVLRRASRPDIAVEEAFRRNNRQSRTQRFEKSVDMINMLTTAIGNLPNLQKVIITGPGLIREPIWDEAAGDLAETLYPNVGIRFRALVEALNRTRRILKELVIQDEDVRAGVGYLCKLTEPKAVFSSVERVTLSVDNSTRYGTEHVARRSKSYAPIPRLLAHMTNLEQIHISDKDALGPHCLAHAEVASALHNISRLELTGLHVTERTLTQFVNSQDSGLKHLILLDLTLEGQTLRSCIDDLRSRGQLKTFQVCGTLRRRVPGWIDVVEDVLDKNLTTALDEYVTGRGAQYPLAHVDQMEGLEVPTVMKPSMPVVAVR